MDDTAKTTQRERLDAVGLHAADAIAFRVLAIVSLASAAVAVAFAVGAIVTAAIDDSVTVQLFLAQPLQADLASPAVESAETDTVTAVVSGVNIGARVLLASGSALTSVIIAFVGLTIALFFWRFAQGRPFHRSLYAATLAAGIALSIGGIIAVALTGIGSMLATLDLIPFGGPQEVVPGFSFEGTSIAVGFVVLAIAFVFRAGTRLQRETEGLV